MKRNFDLMRGADGWTADNIVGETLDQLLALDAGMARQEQERRVQMEDVRAMISRGKLEGMK